MRQKISPRHQVEREVKLSSWLSFDIRLHVSRDINLTEPSTGSVKMLTCSTICNHSTGPYPQSEQQVVSH